MLDAYMELPSWIRMILAMVILGIGSWMAIAGFGGRPTTVEHKLPNGKMIVEPRPGPPGSATEFRTGVVICGIGAALLLACGKTSAEKHGYRF
jgi:hypothetical protein